VEIENKLRLSNCSGITLDPIYAVIFSFYILGPFGYACPAICWLLLPIGGLFVQSGSGLAYLASVAMGRVDEL
jgi:hypothetical protein